MLKLTAAWKLRTALEEGNAPVKEINVRSPLYQAAIQSIKNGITTPEEAALEIKLAANKVKGCNARKDLEDWGYDVSSVLLKLARIKNRQPSQFC